MMDEMTQEMCTYEAVVSEAVQSGSWDEETSRHAASCIHCSEMLHVAEWTRSLSAEPGWPPLGDPDLLWIESRLLSAQMKRDRTMRMFLMLEGACIALLSASVARLSFEILKWAGKFGNLGQPAIDLFATASFSTLLALLLAAATFLIHPFLVEE